MAEIVLKDIVKFYGADKILENVTFEVQPRDKIGLIGRNGAGKTTILKIITGVEDYDQGSLTIKKGLSIGYLDQIPSYPEDYKVIDVLESAFEQVYQLEKEMKHVEKQMADAADPNPEETVKRYAQLVQLFEHMGGYEIKERIDKICNGLKIQEDFRERYFDTLSGGEKTTTILAKVLLQSPDVLLLDEPTNHLDMESIEWLEEFLSQYPGTVIIVSHDRYFLDKAVEKILEVEDGEVNVYEGNYSYYAQEKDRRLTEQFAAFQDQQKIIKEMEKTIKTLKDWGNRAGNAKHFRKAASIQKRLDKMQRIEKPVLERARIKLDFSGGDRSGREVVKIKKLSKAFGENQILAAIDLDIYYGDKTAIIGKNGSGKSTLIKTILGEYQPDSGSVAVGAGVKIGYLQQNVYFPDEDATVVDTFREDYRCGEGEARKILARFLFYGEDVFKTVKKLSGGEKSRLKLCQLMHQDINFLILDEPTNHLDMESREMLEEALAEFGGTLLFISHDRYFINKLADHICALSEGEIDVFPGNYDYYRQKCLERTVAQKEQAVKPVAKIAKRKHEPRVMKENKEKQLAKLEEKISGLEELIKEKDEEMNANAENFEVLENLFKEKTELQHQLDMYIDEWTSLGTEIKLS